MTTRRRRRNVDPDVIAEIERLVAARPRPTGAEIHRQLVKRFEAEPELVPGIRTTQDIAREVNPPPDLSGPWTLARAAPDDIALVMPVLADIAEATSGQLTAITTLEATWVARVRRTAPDLPLVRCHEVARLYLAREARGATVVDLDLYLSIAPWRNKAAADRYAMFVSKRWVRALPVYLYPSPVMGLSSASTVVTASAPPDTRKKASENAPADKPKRKQR